MFVVVGAVLVPIGYAKLGDDCTATTNNCALTCTGV